MDYLFLHCWQVPTLWYLSLSLMGFSRIHPQTIRDVLVAWRRRLKKSWVLGVWKLMPLAIWWSTWKEWNGQIFEGKARAIDDFKLFFDKEKKDIFH